MSSAKRALITGITGQDGSYLAEWLLDQGYEVVGTVRPTVPPDVWRIEHLLDRIVLRPIDLLDPGAVTRLVESVRPTECYNLAASSSVTVSSAQPTLTGALNVQAVGHLLEAVWQVDPRIRFCQASSREMFGDARESPQHERTPFNPRNPYGESKVRAHELTVEYRERHGVFAVSAILFNHESSRRGLEFVTRRVSDGVARIKVGLDETLSIGNLDVHRDWGFAPDYVRAMWLMLQADQPEDYVVATGVSHSVRDLIEVAFAYAGLDWPRHVRVDDRLVRPAETQRPVGDASKARRQLGWAPRVDFHELVAMMVDADLQRRLR